MIEVHHRRMPFISQAADDRAGHTGFVAGRYRDGAYSDIWTDVRRCAFRTFTGYAPACSCGWRGPAQPVTEIAYIACSRAWTRDHAAPPLAASLVVVDDCVSGVRRDQRATAR
ncbi:hypothetical protein [Pseudonocardia sp.]|uniref:hypothetical protein n=1 Tax=Pseudonocardia sp. TaxID=60912 RepID=UPI002601EE85|nr:hypothetical protein [Pseudonocardia sp.]